VTSIRWAALGAALLVVAAGLALAQLTDEDIAALNARAAAEGWSFRVARNPATQRSIDELCGLKKPDNWRQGARFEALAVEPSLLPDHFDWRDVGGCTPVKNQGGCGSCWAFATVGPLECNILIRDGVEVDLSEQWLVSCNQDGWDCDGGWWAHDYLQWKTDPCGGTGAVLEADLPYVAGDVPCDCPYPHPYRIDSWAYVAAAQDGAAAIPPVDAIKQAIMTYGPVSCAVIVDEAFRAYDGGVFDAPWDAGAPLNHAVVLVGWDDSQGTEGVWFLRNSWGAGWGESGYMRIEYGNRRVGDSACFVVYTPAGPAPDLVVNWVSGPSSACPECGDGVVGQGGPYWVNVQVENVGSADSAACELDILVSADQTWDGFDWQVGTAAVPALAPGETWQGAVEADLCPPGALQEFPVTAGYWLAYADALDEVAELNEANNALAGNALLIGPPLDPSDPYPADMATNVPVDTMLSWDAAPCCAESFDDVSVCPTTYDVYFGTDPGALALLAEGLTEPPCDPTPGEGQVLGPFATYAWKVVARNCCGETEGPTWSFTTTGATIEHGQVRVNHEWKTVSLAEAFVDPVVVAGPIGSAGWHPCVVRLRNVTAGSFDIRLQEWPCADDWHVHEMVHWLAVERGCYDLGLGNKLVAEKLATNNTNVHLPDWVALPDGGFGGFEAPVVVAQVQTFNGPETVVDRICGVYPHGMHIAMQEQEASDGVHAVEEIGYIALTRGADNLFGIPCEAGVTPVLVTHKPYTIATALGHGNVRVQEEPSRDAETLHVPEQVGYIGLAGHPPWVADIQTCHGTDTANLRCRVYAGALAMEHGVALINHQWQTMSLANLYQHPVIIAGPAACNGADPGVVRIRNVTSTSFQVRFQEWDYLDGWHALEQVHWFALERGVWDVEPGTVWIVDVHATSNTSVSSPDHVPFPKPTGGPPVVLLTQQSANGPAAVTGRINNVGWAGFDVALQEEEAADAVHAVETLAFWAWGLASAGGSGLDASGAARMGSVRLVREAVGAVEPWDIHVAEEQSLDLETTHAAETIAAITVDPSPPGYPPFVADMQTVNDADTASLRCSPAGTSGATTAQPVLTLGAAGAAPCHLLVRAQAEDGAEIGEVEIVLTNRDAARTETVVALTPIRCGGEAGDLIALSAPASIGHGEAVLLFSHWEVDGEPSAPRQATIEVEMTGKQQAVAVYGARQ